MPRIQGLAESGVLTGKILLKTGPGEVHSITIAYTGATAGNKLYLRDGLDGTALPAVCFVLPAAAGTITKEWPQGKAFATGIFFDEGDCANCFVEITFK